MFSSIRLTIHSLIAAGVLLLSPLTWSAPLNIMLTNDDGWSAPGIQTVKAVLEGAGHNVTIVAPLTNQSGSSGSFNTGVGTMVAILEQAPGVWSVDSTPADSVRAGLGAIMAANPPDLVISGANFGQNLARMMTNQSGTIGAALQAMRNGVPAIAISVGLDLTEAGATPYPFPSTFAAFQPTGIFLANLIGHLEASTSNPGDPLLPEGIMLNVNVPVPYEAVSGIEVTSLALQNDLNFVWNDADDVISSGGGAVYIGVQPNFSPDPISNSDRNAYNAKKISITPMDGDMTASAANAAGLALRLGSLNP